MSSSLLERARGFHEDLEIYERAIIEQLENKPRTQKVRGKALQQDCRGQLSIEAPRASLP